MPEPDASFIENEETGTYTAVGDLTADDIIAKARAVLSTRFTRGEPLSSPAYTKQYLELTLAACEREVFACLFVDNRHRVIAFEKLFFGTIDGASVHPREIVKSVLKHNAAAVILAHNHPSGTTTPSEADRRITTRIVTALNLIDVRVLDHVIVGDEPATSFAENGWL